MTLGTLRDQVIYPDSIDNQHKKGVTDENLGEFLKQVCRTVCHTSSGTCCVIVTTN